jgi:hypothetical protein
MNIKAKEYRKTLNTSYQKYKEKCASELRVLSKNDTKGFWKTLEKYSVDIDTFFEYFKNLNFVFLYIVYHTTVSDHSSEQHSLFYPCPVISGQYKRIP